MQFARASGKDGRDVDPGEIFFKKSSDDKFEVSQISCSSPGLLQGMKELQTTLDNGTKEAVEITVREMNYEFNQILKYF